MLAKINRIIKSKNTSQPRLVLVSSTIIPISVICPDYSLNPGVGIEAGPALYTAGTSIPLDQKTTISFTQ